jgi:hypothetical protein
MLLTQLNEEVKHNKEINRIANHWRQYRDKMSYKQLTYAIGNDFEQLEFTPEQIERYVPIVIDLVKMKVAANVINVGTNRK